MHHVEHFSWFRTNFALVVLPQSYWCDKLLSVCRRKRCKTYCFGGSRIYSCKFPPPLDLKTSICSFSCFLDHSLVKLLLIIYFFAGIVFQGVKVIYRSRELEEKQAKRLVQFCYSSRCLLIPCSWD